MTALDDSAPRGSGSAQSISGDDVTEGRDVTDRDTIDGDAANDGNIGAQDVSESDSGEDADSTDARATGNPADLPDGFQVQIDLRSARGGDLRYLVGGSPTRLMRMSDTALGMTSDDGRIEVCDNVTRRLARALLDAGVANPRPMFGPRPADVTVVIPVKDNQTGVDRLLDALDGLTVVVVDDGSDAPIVADRPGVSVIRFDENRGPAAARNAGAAAATTDFVAFLDSDVVPDPDWLTVLLTHFSDPTVGIVAPRIVGLRSADRSSSLAECYENGWSSLDMGPEESAVLPSTRVPYVPSAAIVVRRSAFCGFDESLRVAEDVDACWRMHAAGWRIRYDPVARVAHDHRTDMRSVLSRRCFYGTGAAHLAARHGNRAAPLVMSVPMAAAVAALLTRTRFGTALAMLILTHLATRLRKRLGDLPSAPLVSAQLTGRAAGFGLLQAADAICRHYWPVALLMALVSRRFRTLAIQVAIVEGVVSWFRDLLADPTTPPALGPFRYLLMRRLDDLAYGAGLWQGVIAHRDVEALRPVISR
ncbi:mycofactocin biosynthesis glycosyltransferase MftF [Gordonia alkanivorans]|uniref:mycofactocin biosynthesis glycosyltransferase MftF n=1 Tax=Gordonia alkanivorans TaxID=84096 RepID=UPI002448DA9E|nr:mycofactocin biosynthesis glycosyltransferase MftF [Gordonia alkanivorans]MDH3019455.1 mycofactocin biosynthesis glycosyltransferase MftF [Gordonia alkanivorans]MDH3046974.1 mycofactocin biosynthesis glycosyltransferase MftF [Gordonia alkanivorans]